MGCHLLQDMDLLTASRTQQGQQQGLKGEALAQFVGTQTLLPSDPPLKEDNLLEYSVKAFLSYLSLSAQETQYLEEQAYRFCGQRDVSYAAFVLLLLHKRSEQEVARLHRQEELERRRQDSIRRIQQPVNFYKKVVDTSIMRRAGEPKDPKESKDPKEPKEPREPREPKEPREPRKRQNHVSARGSALPRNADSGREPGGQASIQVLTCERFWKLVDSMYFKRLPRLSEVVRPRVPNAMSVEEREETPAKELFVWRGADEASGKRRRLE